MSQSSSICSRYSTRAKAPAIDHAAFLSDINSDAASDVFSVFFIVLIRLVGWWLVGYLVRLIVTFASGKQS